MLNFFHYDIQGGPIIVSPNSEQWCTVGCWSLTRPAILFIGKEDGSIEVWNLLEKMIEPVRVYPQVSNAKITCIKPWTSCECLASLVHNRVASIHLHVAPLKCITFLN